MHQAVFNFHDVVLLMTAILCTFFALLLLITNPPHNVSNYFLAAFLITHACIPLNELILWGATFKILIRENAPQLNFIFGFSYYLDAALLYFYVKSLVFRDFQLLRKDAIHLLPLGVYALFMLLAFYRQPLTVQIDWVTNETFTYSRGYVSLELVCKIMRMFYCISCLQLILKYKDILKATRSNIEKIDVLWLKLLVIGFLIVTIMETLLSLSKMVGVFFDYEFQHYDFNIYEIIGLSSYYALFILVSTLVFTSMRYFVNFETIKQKDKDLLKKSPQEKLLNPSLAENIMQMMRTKKPHLQPDITLEILAETLEMSTKDLSMLINRHFNKNFWEFINDYRIEEAKQLLISSKHESKTITDIYLEVGFNSKSVFNTFFKKLVGMTPSDYRQSALKTKRP